MKVIKSDHELIKSTYSKIVSAPKADISQLCKVAAPLAETYGAYCMLALIPLKKGRHQIVVIYGEENYIHGIPEECEIIEHEGSLNAGGKTIVKWVCDPEALLDDTVRSDIEYICTVTCSFCEGIRLNAMANSFFFYDRITGLPNINGILKFAAALSEEKKADKYTAAFINVIGYNYVNRKVGYRHGTKLLKTYGNRLRSLLDDDELIGRMGGDNFVLIFRKENLDKMLKVFNGIKVACRINSSSITFIYQARAGIYNITEPEILPDELMNYISSAVNYSKHYGKNNIVFYTPDIEQKVADYTEYTQRFKSAMESGEFYVDYQPKVYTQGDEIYGAEALVRWNMDGRVIYPGEFIEILEKAHLISELDLFVLEQTCRDMRRWIDSGTVPVKVSINFSNEHLWDDNLIEDIVAIVDRYGIDHRLIEIEMTETADIQEIPKLMAFVDDLHRYGFTVAMDDFGTGYSSLQILQNVHVDVIKIDKAFITEAEGSSNSRENIILRHIIQMASELGVEIVAEGVETEPQRENLRCHKCFRIQGYIYDKPLPEEEFVSRLCV